MFLSELCSLDVEIKQMWEFNSEHCDNIMESVTFKLYKNRKRHFSETE